MTGQPGMTGLPGTSAELETAGAVLDLLRAAAGPQAQVEVAVDRQVQALTRFANSAIHQNVADETTTVRVRLHTAGRTVTAATTVAGEAGVRDLVDRTVAAAAHAPADPGWPGLAPPAPLAGVAGFDQATAAAEPAQRAERVAAFVAAAGGLETAGYCRTLHWAGGFANSAGQSATGATTEAAMDGIARLAGAGPQGGSDGVARLAATRLADLDGAELGARAAAKATAGTDPVELPPGRYEVVLEPPAVADLLSNLAVWGFNGRALAEGRTFAQIGASQFDPSVTLMDDPFTGGPALPYDLEGTPKGRLVLVDAGVTAAVAHDRRSAARVGHGATGTGHAVRLYSGAGAAPANLTLVAGPAGTGSARVPAVDPAAAGLVAGVERGLLVTDLHYTRVLDPKPLVVTGLTRNGVWMIEDGELTRPVRNLRFTQSYPGALAPGAVRRIGPTATLLAGGLVGAWHRAPALHLASWNITGGASG